MKPDVPLVSIVIPTYNEARVVGKLFGELRTRLDSGTGWEIVVVDDGSGDGTSEACLALLRDVPWRWQVVRLSRNFGHQAAYLAGLHVCAGDAAVMMDCDLQDPPEVVPQLVARWREGAKLVVAVRLSRAERGWRKWGFDLFHAIFHRCTGGLMPKNSGNFGLLDRVIIDHLKSLPEVNLFLPALRAWIGFPRAEVVYRREARVGGHPKMNWRRLFNLAWDGLTSFSNLPLRLIGWVGVIIAGLSLFYSSLLVAIRVAQWFGLFRNVEQLGFTTLAVAVLALGGIQLMSLGVIGEYIGRIYGETKRRPQFIIEDVRSSKVS